MNAEFVPSEFLLARQVALNASLCVFFALFGKLFSRLPQRNEVKSHAISITFIIVGAIGSILLVAGSHFGIVLTIIAVVLIGASEAALMLLWLRFYTETSENCSGVCLGVSAVIGSLICFFTFHLTYEASVLILIALPVVSGVLLITMTSDIALRNEDSIGSGIPDIKSAKRPFINATIQLMTMSLFFGATQGCYSPDNALLHIATPIAILGAALAGIVVFAMYSHARRLPNLNPLINASMLIFLAGMMLLPFDVEALAQFTAFLMLTGFIFYFVVILVFIIDLVRTFDLNLTMMLGMNQALEYAMFAVGIIAGNSLWSIYENNIYFPFVLSYVAIFVLSAMNLFLATERPPWIAYYYKPKRNDSVLIKRSDSAAMDDIAPNSVEIIEKDVDILDIISKRYILTPREIEVLGLLAKGRNAEYVQNALFISTHTAKTHIYNIYRKLDVHSLQELLDLLDQEEACIKSSSAENSPNSQIS